MVPFEGGGDRFHNHQASQNIYLKERQHGAFAFR